MVDLLFNVRNLLVVKLCGVVVLLFLITVLFFNSVRFVGRLVFVGISVYFNVGEVGVVSLVAGFGTELVVYLFVVV